MAKLKDFFKEEGEGTKKFNPKSLRQAHRTYRKESLVQRGNDRV